MPRIGGGVRKEIGLAVKGDMNKWHDPENTQHTPGPWMALEPESSEEHWEIEDGFGHTATVYGDDAEAEANARLIAAAPDLLAACKAWEYARKEGGISMVDWFNVAWEKTQAAIAKAGQ